jgi:hypothetical protein
VIALGYWLVKGCLDAMRVGLLNRFMGVVGVAIGPALVLGFGSLILPVWLLALGALYLGFWPTGLPPAWEEGRAIVPPGRADEVEEPVVDSLDGTRNGEVEAVGPSVRGPDSKEGAVGEAAGESRRKRKRRG